MSKQLAQTRNSVSLDSVFNAMQHWRVNKKSYDCNGIPDSIWDSIFQLEAQGLPDKELRRMFGLNSEQYRKKRGQHTREKISAPKAVSDLQPVDNTVKTNNVTSIQFSEAAIEGGAAQLPVPSLTQAAKKTKQAITKLKSTDNTPESYLDTSTIIVECIRPDGHRLKIHTTTHRLDLVMQTFFCQDGAQS